MFIRDILYNQAVRPRVVGKRDARGARRSCPAHGELDADRIAQIVACAPGAPISSSSNHRRVALLESHARIGPRR
jgi:hypothetical protein